MSALKSLIIYNSFSAEAVLAAALLKHELACPALDATKSPCFTYDRYIWVGVDPSAVMSGLYDMTQVAAGLLQQLLDVTHRLFGLRTGVAQPDQVTLKVSANLTAHIHSISGSNRLAEVVIQILIGIRLPGVKHANALMRGCVHRPFLVGGAWLHSVDACTRGKRGFMWCLAR